MRASAHFSRTVVGSDAARANSRFRQAMRADAMHVLHWPDPDARPTSSGAAPFVLATPLPKVLQRQEQHMSRLSTALAAFAVIALTTSYGYAQGRMTCGEDAMRAAQIVRTMPNMDEQANAELYVSQAEKAAQAHDEKACRDWLARATSYIEG
jgi:hypothetical protein